MCEQIRENVNNYTTTTFNLTFFEEFHETCAPYI